MFSYGDLLVLMWRSACSHVEICLCLPKDISGHLPKDISGHLPKDISGHLPKDMSKHLPKDISGHPHGLVCRDGRIRLKV